MSNPDYSLDQPGFMNILRAVQTGTMGDDVAFACNARPTDHLHLRRIGNEGDRLDGRIAVAMHDGTGSSVVAYFAAPEARQIAAQLLNLADELDGATPLTFMPREADE